MEQLNFFIDGKQVGPPSNWKDINIKMSWNGQVQPIVDIDEHTFINEHIDIINDHIQNVGIFEGIKYCMQAIEDGVVYDFNGVIDTTTMRVISPVKLSSKVKYINDIDSWENRFRAVSFGYLALENGIITKADYVNVPVVIQKKFDALEVAFAAFGLYVISRDIAKHAKGAAEAVSNVAQIPAAYPQPGAEILKSILTLLYYIAYYAIMAIAIKKFYDAINQNIMPKKVNYKGIRLKTAIEKVCQYFGMTLVTDIEDMYDIVYLPSKTDEKAKTNVKDEGIPNMSDFGYQVNEMFELVLSLFYARISFADNKCYIFNENNDFWRNQGANVMPSNIELETYKYNAFKMSANRLLRFQYDSSDDWTIPTNNKKDDYTKGTNFQVITDFDSVNGEFYKLNKGLDEIVFPVALGKRRDKLSLLEEALKVLFFAGDQVIKLFGGEPRADKIDENKGWLQISDPSFSIAKLIYLNDSGKIPASHRDYLSARAMYNNYHIAKSFVSNPGRAQRIIYTDIKIPFNYQIFVTYLTSPFFTFESDGSQFAGKQGIMTELSWNMASDYAIASFEVEEIYVKNNLIDTTIES